MKKLKKAGILFTALLLLIAGKSQAQSGCGFDAAMKKAIEDDPSKKIALQKFLAQMENHTPGNQVLGGQINYIIPIVVHIIHDNGASNISDDQVKDAIRILNEDFQKRNADSILVVSAFKPIMADIGIEFRLATIDPNGNCTNGITRTFSYRTSAGDGAAAKSLIHWDTKKYYNVWVVDYLESGGNSVGGYSYLPGTAPSSEKEGSIVINRQFGSIGTSYGSPIAKATLTHETGHYLGLYHTWGVYTAAGSQAACGEDDGVTDTPNNAGSSGTCNTSLISCGVLSNVQNFMDYSSCPYMFTEGQKTRMINAVTSNIGYRAGLWDANNLIATGTNNGAIVHECAPKAEFYAGRKLFCTGDTTVFHDNSYGDSLSSNRYWQWTFEGGTPSSSTSKNPVVTYNNTGQFKVKLKVWNAHGADSLERTDYIETYTDNTSRTVYFSESFEDPNFPVFTSDSSSNFHISSPGTVTYTRNTLAKTDGYSSLSVDLHTETDCSHSLVSPNFDLSSTTTPINLSFDFAYAQMNSNNNDVLKVYYSTDCGTNWAIKTSKNANYLKTKEPSSVNFIPASSEWNSLVLNFDAFAGNPNFRFKILAEARGGNKLYLDNIKFFHGNVGISDQQDPSFSASVYPNPLDKNSTLFIESSNMENVKIELHDVLGRTLYTMSNPASNSIILNEAFPLQENGIYFLKIFNGVEIKTISILF
ncbi:MAG: M43 family zinc metalloprotease [Flavobacteriales bacterium]